jgi:hypothetical protein
MSFESTNLEMIQACGIARRRRVAHRRRRGRSLVLMDRIRWELEELNLAGVGRVPPDVRARAAAVIAQMLRKAMKPDEVPATVPELMEAIFEAAERMRWASRHARSRT